jgi:hypothetical protein
MMMENIKVISKSLIETTPRHHPDVVNPQIVVALRGAESKNLVHYEKQQFA